jgi:hypothetical protein
VPTLQRSYCCRAYLRSYNGFGMSGTAALGPRLAALLPLHSMDLYLHIISASSAVLVDPHLAALSPLHRLELSSSCIRADFAASRGPHLAGLSLLQSLRLGFINLYDGVAALGQHLSALSLLHSMHLGGKKKVSELKSHLLTTSRSDP